MSCDVTAPCHVMDSVNYINHVIHSAVICKSQMIYMMAHTAYHMLQHRGPNHSEPVLISGSRG